MAILAFMNEKIQLGTVLREKPAADSCYCLQYQVLVATEHHQHNTISSFVVVVVDVESSSGC
jgi:hypothetical protein